MPTIGIGTRNQTGMIYGLFLRQAWMLANERGTHYLSHERIEEIA
jgi:hypothetical protein